MNIMVSNSLTREGRNLISSLFRKVRDLLEKIKYAFEVSQCKVRLLIHFLSSVPLLNTSYMHHSKQNQILEWCVITVYSACRT